MKLEPKKNPKKTSEQGKIQQQTQLTWEGEYGNRTRVTEVVAPIHCPICTPHGLNES